MSADNGVILKKIIKYKVINYTGDYENNRREFATLEKAIQFIAKNCNDTEYGITLSGFGEQSNE
jgi:hypothetical protein